MVKVEKKIYSFNEYLNYSDRSDDRYELVNGELKLMPPASGFHALILYFIFKILDEQSCQENYQVMPGTIGVRTSQNKSRIPDIVVLSPQQCQEIRTMTTAILESPPLLVVEIVSPNNVDDDYRYKRSEYAVMEIPEYWIVDPELQKVSVLYLVSGFYDLKEFIGDELLESRLFPELKLTPQQIFEV